MKKHIKSTAYYMTLLLSGLGFVFGIGAGTIVVAVVNEKIDQMR